MTDYLFAQPSFLTGLAALFDFDGSLTGPGAYNFSATPEETDAIAIANDWAAVHGDVRAAMASLIQAHPELSQASR